MTVNSLPGLPRRSLFMASAASLLLRSTKPRAGPAEPKTPPPPFATFVMNDRGQVLQTVNGISRWVSVNPANANDLLQSTKADASWASASLAKLVGVYYILGKINEGTLHFKDEITVSKIAAAQPPTNIGLTPGQTITVEEALEAVLVHSANDCMVALAEKVSGTEENFVVELNKTTVHLGLHKTHLINSTGLPQESAPSAAFAALEKLGSNKTHNVAPSGLPPKIRPSSTTTPRVNSTTTAHDMAVLMLKFGELIPTFGELFKTENVVSHSDGHKVTRTDHGLIFHKFDNPDIEIVMDKTGYILESHHNMGALVSAIDPATQKSSYFAVVVLGEQDKKATGPLVLDLINDAASTFPKLVLTNRAPPPPARVPSEPVYSGELPTAEQTPSAPIRRFWGRAMDVLQDFYMRNPLILEP